MHLFLIEKAKHWQDSLESAVIADTIMPDGVHPSLLLFTTDLNVDLINLTFDEVVKRDSFNFSTLTLLSSSSPVSNMLTLSGGNALPFSGSTVSIQFNRTDLNAIKLDSNLCSVISNC